MKNQYEIRGDVTAIIINSPKHGRQEALISTSKLDVVKLFPSSWHVGWSEHMKSFYVRGIMRNVDGKQITVSLHRWIKSATTGFVVDHVNHNTLDNTNLNLRIITNAENLQNRKGATSKSRSGVRGISWAIKDKKWLASVKLGGKTIYSKHFDNLEEAKKSVIEFRRHHMPFSNESI